MGVLFLLFFFLFWISSVLVRSSFPLTDRNEQRSGSTLFHTTGQPLRLKPFPSTFESIKNQFYWRNSIKKSRFFSHSLSRAQTHFNQLCSLALFHFAPVRYLVSLDFHEKKYRRYTPAVSRDRLLHKWPKVLSFCCCCCCCRWPLWWREAATAVGSE